VDNGFKPKAPLPLSWLSRRQVRPQADLSGITRGVLLLLSDSLNRTPGEPCQRQCRSLLRRSLITVTNHVNESAAIVPPLSPEGDGDLALTTAFFSSPIPTLKGAVLDRCFLSPALGSTPSNIGVVVRFYNRPPWRLFVQ